MLLDNSIEYPDIRNTQDVVFLLRATYYAKSISIISNTYYHYRQHPLSTISIREEPYFNSYLQYFKLYLDFINSHEMKKEHYDLIFIRALGSLKNRYKEMDTTQEMNDFRRGYVKEILELMSEYKYDTGYLIESFFNGLENEKNIQLLKNGYAFRIGKVITWLPSKIKKLLK